jgi:hypothetical protein
LRPPGVLFGGPAAAGVLPLVVMVALVLRQGRRRGSGHQQDGERGDLGVHSQFLCEGSPPGSRNALIETVLKQSA